MEKSKSQKIFEEELFPHMEALKTFAYYLTYNDDDSNDLVQETYLKAHKFIENYGVGTNAKAWLFTIMKNAYINEYRRKVRRPAQVELDDAHTAVATIVHEDTEITNFLDDYYHSSMGDEVTLALNALPYEFKAVLLLCDIEGFSYEEIAKILELPIGTVRSRLFRARNMLKEKLKKYAQKMGYKDLRGKRNDSFFEEE